MWSLALVGASVVTPRAQSSEKVGVGHICNIVLLHSSPRVATSQQQVCAATTGATTDDAGCVESPITAGGARA